MISRLHRRSASQRGAVALEYALVMPLLFAVIFVAVEVIMIMFADANLEAAANQMTRVGKIGLPTATPGVFTRPTCANLLAILKSDLSGWVYGGNPDNLTMSALVYHADGSTSTGCDSGAAGDMVLYDIGVTRSGFTGYIGLLGRGSVWQSHRVLLIQNEE
jgi:hypothetical protein